jgi:hypothetical protein
VWEQSGVDCILRLIFKCMKYVEPRSSTMKGKEVVDFIKSCKFIEVCFDEIPLQSLFKND